MTTGYSGTPLIKKLGMKIDMAILLIDAPDSYTDVISAADIATRYVENHKLQHFVGASSGKEDIVHIFVNTRDNLFRTLAVCVRLIKQNGAIWVSWYKKAAKLRTEITEDTVREAAFPLGLVDVKVCAVDEKWSGFKLVIRKENRV